MSTALYSLLSDELSCFDIIKAFFALSDNEIEILSCIHNKQGIDIERITEIIPKNRTTISRSIQRLTSIGVIRKDKVNLVKGGYKFVYYSKPVNEIKEFLLELIDKLAISMKNSMQNLSDERCAELFKEVVNKYKK
ncbi:MAG: hypothetical protein KAS95_02585 [Candidatus Heimdallarchaeota archaeon]|nr:hypothetical protein [Candidatus Heimdallarchaeota archaeon]